MQNSFTLMHAAHQWFSGFCVELDIGRHYGLKRARHDGPVQRQDGSARSAVRRSASLTLCRARTLPWLTFSTP
jgi:hypothetical protein